MAKDKLGPGYKRFELRPGVGGFPGWGGLDLRADASAAGANALRVAKNVRYWGKRWMARGGQALTAAGMGGVLGIFETGDDEGGGSQKLWGFPYGEPGGSAIIWPSSIYGFNPGVTPDRVQFSAESVHCLVEYNGDIIAIGGGSNELDGRTVTIVGNEATLNPLFQVAGLGEAHTIQGTCILNGELFFYINSGVDEFARCFRWDGVSITPAGSMGFSGTGPGYADVIGTDGTDLYGVMLGSNVIKKWSDPTTWSALTMPVLAGDWDPSDARTFGGQAVFVGVDNDATVRLLGVTGTTVTEIASKSIGSGNPCLGPMEHFDSRLVWLQGVDGHVVLCSWNGVDVVEEFDFTSNFGWECPVSLLEAAANTRSAPFLCSFKGALSIIWKIPVGETSAWKLWKSAGEDLTSWSLIHNFESGQSGFKPLGYDPDA